MGRLIQRYADCSPTRMSLAKCPPRQKGEQETAKSGAMVFVPQLNMGTGEKGVLIANFDINSAAIKANLGQTIYWKQFLRGAGRNKKKWRIEGFSDCQGAEKGNQPLRERRAKAIQSILPTPLRANITTTEGASPGDSISENSTAAQRTFRPAKAARAAPPSCATTGSTATTSNLPTPSCTRRATWVGGPATSTTDQWIGPRAARPGKTPVSSAPFITTGTPFTRTNRKPTEGRLAC